MKYLFVFVPLSVAAYYLGASPVLVFLAAALAIVPIADLMREAAGHVAAHTGPGLGGLITVTFSNATELILAILLISAGNSPALVKATISGSIISNSLLGLGLAAMLGIRTDDSLTFSKEKAGQFSSLLLLCVIALLLPALFDYTERNLRHLQSPFVHDENLSLAVSVVLIVAYAINIIHSLVLNRAAEGAIDAESDDPEELEERYEQEGIANSGGSEVAGHGKAAVWGIGKALVVLLVATLAVAYESEIVSHSVEQAAEWLGLTKFFVGIVVIPIIGNSAEYLIATHFARRARMDITMSIAVGSSVQVALLTAPLLVIVSYFMGNPMDLVFSNPLELFAIVAVAFTVNSIAQDGKITWFEGILLIAVYILLALSFFFLSA